MINTVCTGSMISKDPFKKTLSRAFQMIIQINCNAVDSHLVPMMDKQSHMLRIGKEIQET